MDDFIDADATFGLALDAAEDAAKKKETPPLKKKDLQYVSGKLDIVLSHIDEAYVAYRAGDYLKGDEVLKLSRVALSLALNEPVLSGAKSRSERRASGAPDLPAMTPPPGRDGGSDFVTFTPPPKETNTASEWEPSVPADAPQAQSFPSAWNGGRILPLDKPENAHLLEDPGAEPNPFDEPAPDPSSEPLSEPADPDPLSESDPLPPASE